MVNIDKALIIPEAAPEPSDGPPAGEREGSLPIWAKYRLCGDVIMPVPGLSYVPSKEVESSPFVFVPEFSQKFPRIFTEKSAKFSENRQKTRRNLELRTDTADEIIAVG